MMRNGTSRATFTGVKLARLRPPPPLLDAAVAALLAVLSQLEIWWPGGFVGTGEIAGSRAVLVPTALAATVPLALRRRRPLPVALSIVAALGLQELLTESTEGGSTLVALLVASYSVGAYADRLAAAAGLAAVLALNIPYSADVSDFAFGVVVFGGAWLAGRMVRRERLLAAALAGVQAERERAAVAEERARIARELHDVVAHSVSTIVVQAEAGEALLDREPERAREAFDSIRGSGRQALVELRRMLGLLRRDEDELALVPQPSLEHLNALVDHVRGVGLPVRVEIEGEPRRLPPGVDLSAYRIVQEALTNAIKHGGRARAVVRVRYGTDDLELEVIDDGPGASNGVVSGHGLAGMRERVRLYGGELETGRRPEGGFAVRARLPVDS
jgi:signal transduction histidine kinase